jgi:hypothetical protein
MTNALSEQKSRLESTIDRLHMAMRLAILTVVVGVVIEAVAEFVDAPSTAVLLHRIGAIFVAVGVAAELGIDVWASRYETLLRDANNSIIEQERLARVKIESKFKTRRIDSSTYTKLVEALTPFAGTRIDVFTCDDNILEVLILGDTIKAACLQAGCKCKQWLQYAGHRLPGDVVIAVARDATNNERHDVFPILSGAFAAALATAGIIVASSWGGYSRTDPRVPNSTGAFEPWNPDDVAPFRIQVSEKALVDDLFV